MSLKRYLAAVPYLGIIDQTNWLSRWKKTVRSAKCEVFSEREEMYGFLQNITLRKQPIDYLEFGVADGASLNHWRLLNDRPETRFFGFDSFHGLPERWHENKPQGSFDRKGVPPEIADPRVKFEVGLFQETLPAFLESFSPRHRILIHNDSDLYSSTLYALTMMDRFLTSGSIVIFDEFWDVRGEYKAWQEHALSYRKPSAIIAATKDFSRAAVMY